MLRALRGSRGAGRLDADHFLVPALRPGAWTWGCDRRCAGRGAGRGLGWRTGHVLRGQRHVHAVLEKKQTSKHERGSSAKLEQGLKVSRREPGMARLIRPTSRGVSGVGIAVLQLGRPVRHQRRGRGVLRVRQGVAEDHRLPHLRTLDAGFLLPLVGHEALELLAGIPQQAQGDKLYR